MRPKTTLFILFNFFIAASFAQVRLVDCSIERNADNSISIYADSRIDGEYTLKITFNGLAGYTSTALFGGDIAITTIQRGKQEVMKLVPVKTASMYNSQFKYAYYPGRSLRKSPDSSFVYLLPSTEGNLLRIVPVSSLAERVGKKSDGPVATGFIYNLGDTICATRAGVVYDCNDAVTEGEKMNQTFRRERNRIAIQHKDGSIGNYSAVAPIQLLVKEGDNVIPGQPLAVFNKQNDKYHVLFSTYFLDEKKLLADNSSGNTMPPAYTGLSLHFYVDEIDKSVSLQVSKVYKVQQPKEIIAAEMSKKEKKKLGL